MKKSNLFATTIFAMAVIGPAMAQDRYHDEYDRQSNGPHITVFADDDFRGRSMEITGPIRRLGPTGMEDKISSIGVDSGSWQVCVDDDFRGRCEIIDRSIGRLSRIGMDDKISSIRPMPQRRWR